MLALEWLLRSEAYGMRVIVGIGPVTGLNSPSMTFRDLLLLLRGFFAKRVVNDKGEVVLLNPLAN